jgi:hypothetical protein
MMFSPSDRNELKALSLTLAKLDGKIDALAVRTTAVEQKQSTHEAICEIRDKEFNNFVARTDKDDREAKEEWERFRDESRRDRASIREAIWTSHTNLLWKTIGGMSIIITGIAGIVVALMEKGLIR